jgi:hypothetical protein
MIKNTRIQSSAAPVVLDTRSLSAVDGGIFGDFFDLFQTPNVNQGSRTSTKTETIDNVGNSPVINSGWKSTYTGVYDFSGNTGATGGPGGPAPGAGPQGQPPPPGQQPPV